MRGLRHSGVRIIVPPERTCEPTRITCKLLRVEKVENPPPLCEGEALASRILKMGPVGAKFTGSDTVLWIFLPIAAVTTTATISLLEHNVFIEKYATNVHQTQ